MVARGGGEKKKGNGGEEKSEGEVDDGEVSTSIFAISPRSTHCGIRALEKGGRRRGGEM